MITGILDENRKNIYDSTTSLKYSMSNLEKLTAKINDELTSEIIRNSARNIEVMTSNFANSSKEFINISGNFNKTSSDFSVLVPKIGVLIDAVGLVVCNVNEIILGLKDTLKQRFGGARIFLGKPIK